MVEELKLGEGLIKLDDLKNETQNKNQERITPMHRMKDRGMRREDTIRLNQIFKKTLVLLIKLKSKERNEAEEALKVTSLKYPHYVVHHVSHLPFHIFPRNCANH